MLFIAEQNRKEGGGGKIQSTFSSVRIYIYIYIHTLPSVSPGLPSPSRWKPEGSSRSRVHRMTRWNEVAFDRSSVEAIVQSLRHTQPVSNSILFRVLSNRRLKIFLPTIPL